MSDIAIRVDGLSKRYRIGGKQELNRTIRDTIADTALAPFRRLRSALQNSAVFSGNDNDIIWALRNVSFEVKPGEVVGIIGRNGSGKSTLLKILSRITTPTGGWADIHGRVGSLLEVGTGFHPDLTGRDNVYLNGSILGMKRTEIDHRFDEIVAFAEVDKFIDTPVKYYSSGMYLRLAFSVAAHLDPEILLVDEVLAVGDASFQKKCLGKMEEVGAGGRTVLFVSHDINAVQALCTRAIILHGGQLVVDDSTQHAITHYATVITRSIGTGANHHILFESAQPISDDTFAVHRIELLDPFRQPIPWVSTWDRFVLRVHYNAPKKVARGSVVLWIHTVHGQCLATLSTQPDSGIEISLDEGSGSIDCEIDKLPLAAGKYIIGAALAIPNREWLFRNDYLGIIEVRPALSCTSAIPPANPRNLVALSHSWMLL